MTERFAATLRELAAALVAGDAAPLFAPSAEVAGLPEGPPKAGKAVARHIHEIDWEGARGPAADGVGRLRSFVLAHGPIEWLQFKPKGRKGDARLVKFEIVGQGLWTRGVASVRESDGGIASFLVERFESLGRDRPLFTEVGIASGLSGEDPGVLDHPTLGLAAYGAAAADVDGDGWIDVLTTGHDGNKLFRNRGDGTFERIEVKSPRVATGPLFVDVDGDGDADLFLSCNGRQMLLENRFVPDKAIGFRDVSARAGVDVESIAFSAAAGDINGDGIPDIYVTAYNNYGPVAPDSYVRATNGLPNLLFVSRGPGLYREEAAQRGVAGNGWSYAAQWCDIDRDSRLDLYVANDFGGGNNLYLNRGDRFEDVAAAFGLRDDGYGMGVAFSDYDNDGLLDLHLTKMSSTAGNRILDATGHEDLRPLAKGNSLYRNLGLGRFAEVATFPAGWSWGGGFLDIDNDGFEDVHAPNGFLSGKSQADT